MLSRETLETMATRFQTDFTTIVREYFQHLFLASFYQEAGTEHIFFKGGTALRILYDSPRFSEDLDFSANLTHISTIENAILETLVRLEREGLKMTVEESKKTTGDYIGILRFEAYGLALPIHFEASLRPGKQVGSITMVSNDYLPPYTVVQLSEKWLVQEKITALLSRKKPRDFYDFYFFLRSRLTNDIDPDTFQKVLDELHRTTIPFAKELKTFLPKSHRLVTRDFPSILEQEIRRYLPTSPPPADRH